jgi:hypothetical protein
MSSHGTYFGLVEQQNLRKAEEEEQLAFEQQETTETVLAHQAEENRLNVGRNRASSIISLTPSVIAVLFAKKKSDSTTNEDLDDEDDDKEKKKENSHAAFKMLLMNRPEWTLIVFGCIAALCNGGIQPVFGIILSKLTAVGFVILILY